MTRRYSRLKSYSPSSYWNFSYKDMDETMGPYCYDCPEGIVHLLTPTDNNQANAWRERCLQKAKVKRAVREARTVNVADPIPFSGIGNVSSFTRVPGGRWVDQASGYGVRVSEGLLIRHGIESVVGADGQLVELSQLVAAA